MADNLYQVKEEIQRIINVSQRLKYLIQEKYLVSEIESIRVDGDNNKVDLHTPKRVLRFKAKGPQHVLLMKPDEEGLIMTLDPALAQGIYNIVDEFGQ